MNFSFTHLTVIKKHKDFTLPSIFSLDKGGNSNFFSTETNSFHRRFEQRSTAVNVTIIVRELNLTANVEARKVVFFLRLSYGSTLCGLKRAKIESEDPSIVAKIEEEDQAEGYNLSNKSTNPAPTLILIDHPAESTRLITVASLQGGFGSFTSFSYNNYIQV